MKKKLTNVIAVIIMCCMALLNTSCESEEPEIDVIYTMGFTKVESTNMDMVTIENAFKRALGVSETMFTKHGTVTECDKQVVESCCQAEKDLQSKSLKGVYVFGVRNANTEETVYEFRFNNK